MHVPRLRLADCRLTRRRDATRWHTCGALMIALVLAGCGSLPNATRKSSAKLPDTATTEVRVGTPKSGASLPAANSGRGGYYQDDGPAEQIPDNLLATPDPLPQLEPFAIRGNKPYKVFGKTYTPISDQQPFKQRGVGSWYGKKFHGQKTSSGEPYDMFKMTAAHPTLPIPSYARVTNLSNGNQVIVRINDRGPFHSSRVIDLSYTAALKLGYLSSGSSQLEVERLLPDEIARLNQEAQRGRRAEPAVVNPVAQIAPANLINSASISTAADTSVPVDVLALFDGAPEQLIDNRPAPVNTVAPATIDLSNSNNSTITQTLTNVAASNASAAPGFYLQFGAYSQAANAQVVRERLLQRWSGILPTLELVQSGALLRLYSGPFATRAQAASVAQQVSETELMPLIVQR